MLNFGPLKNFPQAIFTGVDNYGGNDVEPDVWTDIGTDIGIHVGLDGGTDDVPDEYIGGLGQRVRCKQQ